MPNIQLKAKLQAYSKTPFYEDWVRDIAKIPNYDPNKSYVRATGEDGVPFWK